jgi:hypothetical protein
MNHVTLALTKPCLGILDFLNSSTPKDTIMPLVDPITMSSALARGPLAQAIDSKPKTTIAAVPTYNNALSKGVSFGRVAVLLGLLAARFNELVAEPVQTLQSALPVVAAIQVAYVVLCLPAAGSQQAKAVKKPRPGEKRKAEASGTSSLAVCSSHSIDELIE